MQEEQGIDITTWTSEQLVQEFNNGSYMTRCYLLSAILSYRGEEENYPQFTAVTVLGIRSGLMNPRKYRNSPVQELRELSE